MSSRCHTTSRPSSILCPFPSSALPRGPTEVRALAYISQAALGSASSVRQQPADDQQVVWPLARHHQLIYVYWINTRSGFNVINSVFVSVWVFECVEVQLPLWPTSVAPRSDPRETGRRPVKHNEKSTQVLPLGGRPRLATCSLEEGQSSGKFNRHQNFSHFAKVSFLEERSCFSLDHSFEVSRTLSCNDIVLMTICQIKLVLHRPYSHGQSAVIQDCRHWQPQEYFWFKNVIIGNIRTTIWHTILTLVYHVYDRVSWV